MLLAARLHSDCGRAGADRDGGHTSRSPAGRSCWRSWGSGLRWSRSQWNNRPGAQPLQAATAAMGNPMWRQQQQPQQHLLQQLQQLLQEQQVHPSSKRHPSFRMTQQRLQQPPLRRPRLRRRLAQPHLPSKRQQLQRQPQKHQERCHRWRSKKRSPFPLTRCRRAMPTSPRTNGRATDGGRP